MVGVHLINLACSTLESLVYVIFKLLSLFFILFLFFSVNIYIICSKKIHNLCSIVVVITVFTCVTAMINYLRNIIV